MNKTTATLSAVLGLALIGTAGALLRYDVIAGANGAWFYRADRLTGHVELCGREGCRQIEPAPYRIDDLMR